MNTFFQYFFILFLLLYGIVIPTNLYSANDSQADKNAQQSLSLLKENYSAGNWETIFNDAQLLLKFAKDNSLPFYEGKSNFYLGLYYSTKMESDSSIYFFQNAKKAFLTCRDTLNMGIMSTYTGLEFKKTGDTENALLHYHKGCDLLGIAGDTIWYGFVNNKLGMTYLYQGNYILALKHLQRSLSASEKSGNQLNIGIISNALGAAYRKINDKLKEEEAYLKAIHILEPLGASLQLGQAYNNLSEVYLDNGEIEKGFETLEKAKTIYESTNYPLGLCSYYAVLSYYNLNTLKPANYDKVINYCLKSLEIAEEYEDYRQYADVTSFLGTAYVETNQLEKARRILEKGLSVAQEYNFKHEIIKITKVLADAYEKDNKPQKALNNLREYILIKDSIVGEEKIKEFTQLDLEFKFNQQQIRDSLEHVHNIMEKDFQHRKELQSQKQSILILIFVALLFIVTAFFVFLNARKNEKQVQILSEKNALINLQKIENETYATDIQEAYIKLQELDDYKQAMTNMLVHDLKNPLNLLVNLEVFDNDEEMRLIVNRTSKQMLNMIMNLLDISKAEHNDMQLNKTEVQLFNVLDAAIRDVDFLCLRKKINIENKSSDDFLVQADKEILFRIFINLFTNAIKFAPSGSTVFFNAIVTKGQLLRISVTDTGVGIAKEHHSIIFEKFKQIKQPTAGEVGTNGLGLAFCKMAAESHNWHIGVESEPDKGSEFWITIGEYQKLSEKNG